MAPYDQTVRGGPEPSPWIRDAIRKGLVTENEARRSCQLLRTAAVDDFEAAPGKVLWNRFEVAPAPSSPPAAAAPSVPSKIKPNAEPAAPPPPEEPPPVRDDPEAGAFCISHVWDRPSNWEQYFGTLSFADSKQLQATTGLARAISKIPLYTGGGGEKRRVSFSDTPGSRAGSNQNPTGSFGAGTTFGRTTSIGGRSSTSVLEPLRLWSDVVSVPPAVSPSDHPLEQTVWGPFELPVRRARSLFTQANNYEGGYTLLAVQEALSVEEQKELRSFDDRDRPSHNVTPVDVRWMLAPGQYHVLSARVISADRLSPTAAAANRLFEPQAEHFQAWLCELTLRDEVWIEITLGSARCEYLLLMESMLMMHRGFVAIALWNYFDRLWPLTEWAVFCARRGLNRLQLAADAFVGPARVEYYNAIRRISVVEAACRDPRDRELLLSILERVFVCEETVATEGYTVPGPCTRCFAFNNDCVTCKDVARRTRAAVAPPSKVVKSTLTIGARTVELRDISLPEKRRVVDYSAVERYVRATAVAAFAREAAFVASGAPHCDDEGGWAKLSEDLGLSELHTALKQCKPRDWYEQVEGENPEGDLEREELYFGYVERWWANHVLPALQVEQLLACGVPAQRRAPTNLSDSKGARSATNLSRSDTKGRAPTSRNETSGCRSDAPGSRSSALGH